MNTVDIMSLLFVKGIGRAKALKIINENSCIKKVVGNIITEEEFNLSKGFALKLLEDSNKLGIGILSWNDDKFPKQLKMIKDPPLLLYTKGNQELLTSDNNIAVIGSREPSKLGKGIAFRFGELLSKRGYCIVSGFAIGCDSEAHKGCISNKGKTIAVMPCGLDTVYPSKNKELYEDILNNDGLFISEYPIKTKIRKNYFVERDRLQSGLSKGVIVVECKEKSGTMHTARFCVEQDRTLGCFYSKPGSHNSGNKMLCENGATIINKEEHINYYIEKMEEGYNYLINSKKLFM